MLEPAPAEDVGLPWPQDWIGPYWVERAKSGGEAGPRNLTSVNWTELGGLSSPARAAVDPRGFISVEGRRWGLDWWVGADDRWHFPSREAAVRQSLVDDTPIVQTTMRIPGGNVHQRVYAVTAADEVSLVIEFFNDSPAPLALALAVRPITVAEVGAIRSVALRGNEVAVDGLGVLAFPQRPSRALLSVGAEPDPMLAVTSGAASDAIDDERHCPQSRAGAVVIVPVSHRSTWRARLRLDDEPLVGRDGESSAGTEKYWTTPPPHDAVARGWKSQVDAGLRVELPSDRVTNLIEAARCHLLLAGSSSLDAEVAVAAASAGFASASPEDLLEAAAGDGLGKALWGCARLVAYRGETPSLPLLADATELAAQSVLGRRRRRGVADDPSSTQAHIWTAVGLDAASGLLASAGERRAAQQAAKWAAQVLSGLAPFAEGDSEMEQLRRWLAIESGIELAIGGPLPSAALSDPVPTGALRQDVDRFPAAELLAAMVPAISGEEGWSPQLVSVVDLASPTAAWPDRVRSGGGSGQCGHSALVTARFWSAVRSTLVHDHRPGVLAVLPGWPSGWDGQNVEVHGMATKLGAVSFALRWHGERPALLWSVPNAPPGLRITAPGFDPAWVGDGSDGEALLARRPRHPEIG